jgi:LuxR family maltose regulon positive regulatory protein
MALPASADPILRTKIQTPRLRPQRVERERLIQRLRETAFARLTLVSAPAGFGKTTLLAAWAQDVGCPVAWLALDEADNALERFLRYLAAALDKAVPGSGAVALALLSVPQPLQPEAFISALINGLADFPNPLILVIDDYHLIATSSIHTALEFFLDHLPDCLRVVIAGRSDPPLSLARLRARGELVELRGADLRFTSAEAADFLNQVMGLRLTAEEVEAVETRTEGWIAGLQLAAISLQDRPDTERFLRVFTGSHRYVLDYLVEEVLRRQSEEIQQFLLQTSILERMCAALCAEVMGEARVVNGKKTALPNHQSLISTPASSSILSYLERSNLFLVPLDDEGQWYRYHRLFADLLRFRLEQTQPDLLPGLHRRAAAWFERSQLPVEAVQHYLAAGDLAPAARLVEQDGQNLLAQGQVVRLMSWMDSLPPAVFDTLPRLHVMYAWGLITTGQLDLLDVHLDQAKQKLRKLLAGQMLPASDATPEEVFGQITSTRAIVATLKKDYREAIRLTNLALEAERKSGVDSGMSASLQIGLGVAYRAIGDTIRAEQAFAESAENSLAIHNYAVGITALCNRGDCWLEMGDLALTELCYRKALAVQEEIGALVPLTSLAYGGLSELAYERNDLDAALNLIRSAVQMDEQWGSPEIRTLNQARLARILMERGEIAAGWQALSHAEEMAREKPLNPFDQGILETFEVSLWLHYGKTDLVTAWLEQNPPGLPAEITYFDEPKPLATSEVLVVLGLREGSPARLEQALALLEPLIQVMRSRGQNGWMIPALILHARASFALGRPDQALAQLEDALQLAAPQGYLRTFTHQAQDLAEILRLARPTTRCPEYVDRLLAAFPAPPPQTAAQPETGGLLSPRELEVLRLVVRGLSNTQIADQLVLAPGTVKRHLHNIFEKLDVTTRPQAIAKARSFLP